MPSQVNTVSLTAPRALDNVAIPDSLLYVSATQDFFKTGHSTLYLDQAGFEPERQILAQPHKQVFEALRLLQMAVDTNLRPVLGARGDFRSTAQRQLQIGRLAIAQIGELRADAPARNLLFSSGGSA